MSGATMYPSMIWKNGLWLASRAGRSASTTFSNGTSWWAAAPAMTSRARPSSSRNVGSPARLTRSTTVAA